MNLKTQRALQHWPQILIAMSAITLSFFDRTWFSLRPWVALDHQWWRIVTGHLVHTNTAHLVMNLLGLFIVSLGFYREVRWQDSILVLIILCAWVSLLLLVFDQVEYLGLSAILHGYLSFLLIQYWRDTPALHVLCFSLLTAKIIAEQLHWLDQSNIASIIGAPVAIQAHLYGFIGGIGCGLVPFFQSFQFRKALDQSNTQ